MMALRKIAPAMATVMAMAGALLAFDIPFLWLEGPEGRSNRYDPKSPLYAPTSQPTLVPPLPTCTRTNAPTSTVSPTFSGSPTPSATPSASETSSPSPTMSETETRTQTPSPSPTPSPSASETSTLSPSPSGSPTASPSSTASPTATVTQTSTPTPPIFEDLDSGALSSPNTYNGAGSSVVYSLDSGDYVSGPNSLHLVLTCTDYAGFNIGSNYYNASSVVDATGMQSASLKIKTDKDLRFSIRFKEGTLAESGGDTENWESRWAYVTASPAWQTVSVNLYQFREDLWDADCNPTYLPPASSPCLGLGNGSLALASIKKFEVNFDPVAGTADIHLDDIVFSPALVPHNGDLPKVITYDIEQTMAQFKGWTDRSSDKLYTPCPASSSSVSPAWQSSGGWDGGPYLRVPYTVDSTPDCGFAWINTGVWLGESLDLSSYTGLRFRHREDLPFLAMSVVLGTYTDLCTGGWNDAYFGLPTQTAWTTQSIPFSSFTDSGPCPFVGSGSLGNVTHIIFYGFSPGTHQIDLDDIEFY